MIDDGVNATEAMGGTTIEVVASLETSRSGNDLSPGKNPGNNPKTSPLDLPSKRRPGRAKGSPRVPGSGKRVGSKNWTSNAVRDFFIDDVGLFQKLGQIIRGERIHAGPQNSVGKEAWRRPSVELQAKVATEVLRKILPDEVFQQSLIATVAADVGPDASTAEGRRQIARSILQILGSGVGQTLDGEFNSAPEHLPVIRTERETGDGAFSPNGPSSSVDHAAEITTGPRDRWPAGAAGGHPSPPAAQPEDDANYQLVSAETGCFIQRAAEPVGGVRRWQICDQHGRVWEAHHATKEAALRQARILVERRLI
jgi:hypothetical protein